MKVERSSLTGVVIFTPEVHRDGRGTFIESYRMDSFESAGIWRPFVQQNESQSGYGVLRGLHFQLVRPQAKLVHVVRGRARDVVVDLRPHSPTFRRFHVIELSESNRKSVYVPRGFAHGFLALAERTVVTYLCDEFYSGAEDQRGIRWDDPSLSIPWRIPDPILSAKDAELPHLNELRTVELPTSDP